MNYLELPTSTSVFECSVNGASSYFISESYSTTNAATSPTSTSTSLYFVNTSTHTTRSANGTSIVTFTDSYSFFTRSDYGTIGLVFHSAVEAFETSSSTGTATSPATNILSSSYSTQTILNDTTASPTSTYTDTTSLSQSYYETFTLSDTTSSPTYYLS